MRVNSHARRKEKRQMRYRPLWITCSNRNVGEEPGAVDGRSREVARAGPPFFATLPPLAGQRSTEATAPQAITEYATVDFCQVSGASISHHNASRHLRNGRVRGTSASAPHAFTSAGLRRFMRRSLAIAYDVRNSIRTPFFYQLSARWPVFTVSAPLGNRMDLCDTGRSRDQVNGWTNRDLEFAIQMPKGDEAGKLAPRL
jgi:hypothetical protein